ncbi:unnamed protein product, partial [Mesorhabditis spiculigera]
MPSRRPPDFLSPGETFAHYENRSPSAAGSYQPQVPRPPSREVGGSLACEYRAHPYVAVPVGNHQPVLACEYRAAPSIDGSTRITSTFLPKDKKIPLRILVGGAICCPILLGLILFLAVWLQQLGIL